MVDFKIEPRCAALIALLISCAMAHGAPPTSGLDLPGFETGIRVQDDLFRAANGAWIGKTQIPADKPEYGIWIQLSDQSDLRVRAIVDELAAKPQKPGDVEHKIATYYRAQVDTAGIDRVGLKPAQAMLDSIAAIRSRAQLARWLGQAQGQMRTPIVLWVMPDLKDPSLHLARVGQGGLGMRDRGHYLMDDDPLAKAHAAYLDYLTRLASLAGERQPKAVAQQVLALERRIAEVHWDKVDNRDPVKIYNPMTPAELARMAPGFDWPAFLAAGGLGGVDRLSVRHPSAATAVAKLLAEVDLAQWHQHLTLRVLDQYAEVLPKPSAKRVSPSTARR